MIKKCLVVTAVTLSLIFGIFALSPGHASARPRQTCIAGGINLTSWRLQTTKRKNKDQRAYIAGRMNFTVICAPLEGGFDLRIQVWHEPTREWLSKDVVKKDVGDGNTHNGEKFTMSVRAICAEPGEHSKLSWRLRLFVAPGKAADGTPTKPELHYYPIQKGKQYPCPAPPGGSK